MQKYEHAFGKNDIRGIYGEDITEELFYNIATGYVKWICLQSNKQPQSLKISVCMDARLHSPALKDALINGLIDNNVGSIEDLGLQPTPIGYYSEVAHNLDGAMIITASHNPKEYNGMKMTYNRQTLNEAQIKEVKELTYSNWKTLPNELKTYEYKTAILPEYISEMTEKFGKIGCNIKVVVDSANATGGIVGPELYKALGCEVIELYSEPDGTFPNHHPNPSDLKTLKDLSKCVVENSADFGIAYDGDSDRIGVVDSQGKPLTGDKLLLIYAMDIISEKPTVVSEVKCSQVLFDTINQSGGNAVMCKTGHGYIKEKMKETNAVLGGEMSGHTFFKDRYYGFDDAIYAGCRMIEIVAKHKTANSNFKIEELIEPFNKVFTSDEVRFPCPNHLKKEVLEAMKKEVSENPTMFGSPIKEIVTLDGMRIVFNGGFALIRQSNTEPVFTLRFEANNEAECNQFKIAMISFLEQCVNSKV
ncbi:MAG: phosphomannomutase/phosphoglucomutase [Cyanobacteria bacterium SIG26]|nr:phosphomannomutase/phosphoglucomutase [Cyanobacteria bacterium SIG26]